MMTDGNPADEADDAEWIRAAQGGDLEAYERLVNRYQAGVRAFAAVRISMRYEAEDLAQEAFVIAWRKLGEFDAETSFGAWLKTIAHRLVLNHRRKFRAEGVGGHRELEELLNDHGDEGASERLAALRDCLAGLDGPALRLLNERYLDGVSVKEIASRTGRGYSALTMQLFRLRELLAVCVENEMAVEGGGGVKDFGKLAAEVTEGGAGEEEARELLEMCRKDPELRKRFANQVDVDRLLEIPLRDASGVSFGKEVVERIGREAVEKKDFVKPVMLRVVKASDFRKRARRWAAAGIAAAVLLGMGWIFMGPEAPARLHRDDAATWSGAEPSEKLKAGTRLRLESGLAEVHFRDGAELILEGPADLEIRGPGAGWLHRGKVAVNVPERAIGFTLESPGGRVIDLGTSFGVAVEDNGATETQVFEGKVKVRPVGRDVDFILTENESFEMGGAGRGKSAGTKEGTFVTGHPPRASAGMDFVHWPMDEGHGDVVKALRRAKRVDPVPAELRSFEAGERGPGWIGGPFGGALSFNGSGQALETFHEGPAGDAARTIAFWVRVPEDFSPAQGYGIISWGKLPDAGMAWQISANPFGGEERLGRLRVGIGYSDVVGVTDLRDGKWHHCAVVMYQDEKRRDRFPVLLYVDGKMERASNKAVYGVRTGTGEGARKIWMGRSLGHGQPERNHSGTGFFRGDLDEVYVFEGALNRRQIAELMKSNVVPESR